MPLRARRMGVVTAIGLMDKMIKPSSRKKEFSTRMKRSNAFDRFNRVKNSFFRLLGFIILSIRPMAVTTPIRLARSGIGCGRSRPSQIQRRFDLAKVGARRAVGAAGGLDRITARPA